MLQSLYSPTKKSLINPLSLLSTHSNIIKNNKCVSFPQQPLNVHHKTEASSSYITTAMQNSNSHRNIKSVYSDFDGTISVKDSVSLQMKTIAEDAIANKRVEDIDIAIRMVNKQYMEEYSKLVKNLYTSIESGKEEGLTKIEKIEKYFSSVSEFLKDWNTRVEEKMVLKGVSRDIFLKSAKQLDVHDSCVLFLEECLKRGISVDVVSVNWSAEWIAAVLKNHCQNSQEIKIYANELEYENGISTGKIQRGIECCNDKAQILNELYEKNNIGNSVYIGDSLIDLPSLIKADFGIIFGEDEYCMKILKKFGVNIKDLKQLVLSPQPKSSSEKFTLYKTSSWREIYEFIFGPTSNTFKNSPLLPSSNQHIPKVLIIAGSDSGAGAGIQADLKTCLATGSFATTAITAITSQNTYGCQSVHPIPSNQVDSQISSVLSDIGTDVVKIGMVPNVDIVRIIMKNLEKYKIERLVLDPVLVTTSGHSLVENGVLEEMIKLLFDKALVITPNIPEAEYILGGKRITTVSDMEAAAREIFKMGPKVVVIKGGHLDNTENENVVDVIYDGVRITKLENARIYTKNTHGTGCTLASAIASELAKGSNCIEAIVKAKTYLYGAMESSKDISIGSGDQRPLNHGFKISDLSTANVKNLENKKFDLKLYAITDSTFDEKFSRRQTDSVKMALTGGATFVQVREKNKSTRDFLNTVLELKPIAKNFKVPLVVNDRVDIALAADVDGVHIGQEDMSVVAARRLLGSGKIIGVSVKTVEQAKLAEAGGADYLGVGAIYPTITKDASVVGLQALTEISNAVSIPVVSIGGITIGNTHDIMKAGSSGIAVISAIFNNNDPESATRELRKILDTLK